ncbi:MAG TPA: aminodeoxychorismate synthase component I [Pyrinomonadaceae bacterium]|nr:aminodeoxychorismate synthase component I [Pyrinomonadaceae bacterium]
MREINITADELVASLLRISETECVCLLDSCGVGNLGSHLLIAGIDPVETVEISDDDPAETLAKIDEYTSSDLACIFSISYDFGQKLLGLKTREKEFGGLAEPDVFVACFDVLVFHDYDTGKTFLTGNDDKFDAIWSKLTSSIENTGLDTDTSAAEITFNFTRSSYIASIETIKERIRSGDTYQTNLTQQLSTYLPDDLSTQQIFLRLRRDHPAPFAAFLKRQNSTVVSASPERFFKVDADRTISTSPIKGTRPRGATEAEDKALRQELLTSKKDLAENTMIVDLLRNDLGRVCEYGSVEVEKLCELEEHPTFLHLVSTVNGKLRENIKMSEILRAVFPCGSITGAPKISTMRIIDEIETARRGLSMGAIGYSIRNLKFGIPNCIDLSVAIRTAVIRDQTMTFNVGGGIVIDSDPESEYVETLTKAKALLAAIGGKLS